ncbi:MAG: HutD family protein [Peptostreptococcaceae bacterium]|jgi:environmental stress-induced protein Ves|nr:HutD family protein [Peptostreptococcaceae bacterium]
MTFEIIKQNDMSIKNWSGGISKEIFIYPKDSSYENRDFKFRISSAKVELEESDFTRLENIKRVIMVLEGELKLVHGSRYKRHLKRFNQDTFMGDWGTKSYGKAIDFNLMLREDIDGRVDYIDLKENESINITKTVLEKGKKVFHGLYIESGEVIIEGNLLKSGEFILIQDFDNYEVNSIKSSNIILSKVKDW